MLYSWDVKGIPSREKQIIPAQQGAGIFDQTDARKPPLFLLVRLVLFAGHGIHLVGLLQPADDLEQFLREGRPQSDAP